MKSVLRACLGLWVLCGTVAGWAASEPATQPRIPVILCEKSDESHPFWGHLRRGALAAGKKFGCEVEILAPERVDAEAQSQLVEQQIRLGATSLVLAPSHQQKLPPAVEKAAKNGIRVVIVVTDLYSRHVESFIGTDNFQLGRAAGESLTKALQGHGTVFNLRVWEGNASTMRRERGFAAYLKEQSALALIELSPFGGATPESAFETCKKHLEALRQADGQLKLDGIFCSNGSTTTGAVRYLRSISQAGKIKVVGVDWSPELLTELRAGSITSLFLQDPYLMGYQSIQTMMDLRAGKAAASRIYTPIFELTAANIDSPDARQILQRNESP